MIKTLAMLLDELKDYANPYSKISRMVKQGECFRVVKNLYVTERNIPGHLLAGSIYGPSYISFDYALSYYGMIPEAVYTITCATFAKKKKKKYETPFGVFTYRDVPDAAFPLCLQVLQEGEYFYRIAEPEKALCDKLYTLVPMANARALADLLLDDLRMEEEALAALNLDKIKMLSEHYRIGNIRKLVTLIRRMQK
ncbi:MAG: hypothetical protein Q4E64_00505 [Phascolarctobacterium sp.]|nr:hypothetical protein [Phascolarctobacterium sp.]